MKQQRSAREQFKAAYGQALQKQAVEPDGVPISVAEAPPPPAPAMTLAGAALPRHREQKGSMTDDLSIKTSEELQQEKDVIKVRETGFLSWKTVLVPPNAYVVHTRRGRREPVTLGLGISFPYNPYSDSYLVVPAAMQTIGIVANCITQEKQGINVLAYVQWLISDFAVAYKKLDFSDSRNPVAIVNAQLREQAEAAIKDKIATMSIEEVLTDKAPIIEELTTRMKSVAEGRGDNQEGLGLKIVTVQIKEALVSSQSLWSNLQAPFRHEKEQVARLSNLLLEEEIHKKEVENHLNREFRSTAAETDIKKLRAEKETEGFEIETQEAARRFTMQQEDEKSRTQSVETMTLIKRESDRRLQMDADVARQQQMLEELQRQQEREEAQLELAKEQARREQDQRAAEHQLQQHLLTMEQELARLKQEAETALLDQAVTAQLQREVQTHQVHNAQKDIELQQLQHEQAIMNTLSDSNLKKRLIQHLPVLAENMPKIDQLKTIQISDNGHGSETLTAFVAKLLAVGESLGLSWPKGKE